MRMITSLVWWHHGRDATVVMKQEQLLNEPNTFGYCKLKTERINDGILGYVHPLICCGHKPQVSQ